MTPHPTPPKPAFYTLPLPGLLDSDLVSVIDILARWKHLRDGPRCAELDAADTIVLQLTNRGHDLEFEGHLFPALLVSDRYFPSYARIVAEKEFATPQQAMAWPFRHIDWDKATEELKAGHHRVDLMWRLFLFRRIRPVPTDPDKPRWMAWIEDIADRAQRGEMDALAWCGFINLTAISAIVIVLVLISWIWF